MKRCTTCKQHKPLTEYCKNKRSPDGLDWYCHSCILIRVKKYQAKNKYISEEDAIKIDRKCSKCQEVKSLIEFYKKKANKYGYSFVCKVCSETERRTDRKYNPSKYAVRLRKMNLKRKFNMTQEDYEAMLRVQDGKCKICGTSDPKGRTSVFHIDHCHISGKVRGLLCNSCNIALGGFKDSINSLKNAISYLEYNSPTSAEQAPA